ncbi:MAG: pseudaminic acid cytidylyltransferase, partial [Campylobacter sp.]|nr:pseudaminic acid cytidylyltransferase [Campylobacter sp.]
LLSAERLRQAYELFCKKNASSLVPVVKFSFPPQRAFVLKDGYLSYKEPLNAPKRSQDLEPLYHDAGAFYFYKTADFLANKTEGRVAMILSEIEVQDIDNIDDWCMAELKYKVLNECSNKS